MSHFPTPLSSNLPPIVRLKRNAEVGSRVGLRQSQPQPPLGDSCRSSFRSVSLDFLRSTFRPSAIPPRVAIALARYVNDFGMVQQTVQDRAGGRNIAHKLAPIF